MAIQTSDLPAPPATTVYRDTDGGVLVRSAPRAPRRGFTAAARRLDPTSERDKQGVRKSSSWHPLAWQLYDNVGEVKFGAKFIGKCLSKLRVFPALQLRPEDAPVSLGDLIERLDDGDEEVAALLPPGVNQAVLERLNTAALDVLARIDEGALGGLSELQYQYGINQFVTGESHLVGYETGDPTDPERWLMASTSVFVINQQGQMSLKLHKDWRPQDYIPLGSDAIEPVRIWNQHPQWPEMPDSSVLGVLEIAETLWYLTQEVKGTAMAGLNNGILFMPNGMFKPVTEPAGETHEESPSDEHPLVRQMYDHFETPIQDPASASVVSPFIMRADREDIAAVKWVTPDRPHDAQAAKDREEMVRRYAQGVDLPPEIITGMAESNHWTAWQIDANTFNAHVEPVIRPYCWAFGRGVVVPLVASALGTELEVLSGLRLTTWYSDTDLVAQPDQSGIANDGHDRLTISDDGWRKLTGVSDEYAPDEEEVARRLAQKAPAAPALPMGDRPAEVEPGPPQLEAVEDEEPRVAAAGPSRIGRQLAEIDKALLVRLQQAADDTVRRAIERAGAKLRQKSRGTDGAAAAATVPNSEVALVLGPSRVAALAPTDELLASALDQFGADFRNWVGRAQDQALSLAADEIGELEDDELAAYRSKQEDDREAAWLWLSAALLATASTRLFDPSPAAPPLGEFDATKPVPPGVIRQAIGIAGGDSAPSQPTARAAISTIHDTPAGGVATGETIHGLLVRFQIQRVGYVWVYGDPSSRTQPFDPHMELDGKPFMSWDDEVLANPTGWPEEFCFPGDHLWCQCNFEPNYENQGEEEGEGEG